ncbi:hypothetical protein [Roseococcus sp. YIM B11640]|uniref:hypothetical protein n=1 Tax=Roseococcus sp. YIM B11640 TaxID=3133973 RepID=UPI003C7AF6A9
MPPDATPAEIEAAWRDAVYENPHDRAIWRQWSVLDPRHETAEAQTSLQEAAPTLIPPLVSALLTKPGFEEMFSRFEAPTAAWLVSDEALAIGHLWQAHGEGTAIDPADAEQALAGDVATFAAFLTATRWVVRGDRPDADQRHRLADIGIDAAALSADLKEFIQPDANWRRVLDQARFASDGARRTVLVREGFCGYQDRAVREGTLAFRDPFSGEICHPVDSFLMFGRSCYLYRGRHPFYLIGAGAGSKALCLFVPAFNLIVDFRAALSKFIGAELWANFLVLLLRRLAMNVPGHNAAMARETVSAAPRRLIVCIQQAQNFAHHVWNFYTGLERIVLDGHHRNVERVLFGGSEFFGALDEIFPEFEGRVSQVERDPIIDPCPFSDETMLLTVGGYFIPETLRTRLRAAMRKLPAREGVVSPERPDPALESCYPVVWIGIRSGDKSWVGQEEGIQRLIRGFAERYPRPLFLIDGFSFPVGRDEISQEWLGAINALRELAERVRQSSGMPERVVNMVGNTLRESVLWAERADVYLSPVGTTQHKIGWFTDAPGLVYSAPRGRAISPDDRLPGSWEAEGSARPTYMIGRPASQGARRGENDRRAHLDNIDLDADEILAILLGMLDQDR